MYLRLMDVLVFIVLQKMVTVVATKLLWIMRTLKMTNEW